MWGALTMEEIKTSIILLLRIKKEGAPRRDQTKNKNFLHKVCISNAILLNLIQDARCQVVSYPDLPWQAVSVTFTP